LAPTSEYHQGLQTDTCVHYNQQPWADVIWYWWNYWYITQHKNIHLARITQKTV